LSRISLREYLTFTDVKAPFNRVIRFSLKAMPHWEPAASIDLAQHIFYHRLPRGGNDRQALYDFVARLHVPMLDRSRPLWALHVIDGLDGGRFALYQKVHHAYADGVTMARWTAQGLAATPDQLELTPVWSQRHSGHGERRKQASQELMQSLWKEVGGTTMRVLGVGRLAAMLLLESVRLTKNAIALPFVSTARTPLTGQVTPGRQFTTAAVAMERVDAIRARTRSTLNHVALTCLDGALRRYLQDQGVDLKRPITIQMPVNLRREGEKTAGNKIGIIQVELSPPTDDPYVRLRNIGFSLRNVRTMIDSVAPEGIESYTVITGLVAQLAELLRLSNTLPPMGNTLVSNVPGPKEHLYLKGARMEEMHPISTLPPAPPRAAIRLGGRPACARAVPHRTAVTRSKRRRCSVHDSSTICSTKRAGSARSCSSSHDSAPWRRRLRRLSCIRARNSAARAGSMRYSMVTTTRRGLRRRRQAGALKARCEGLRSSSMWRSGQALHQGHGHHARQRRPAPGSGAPTDRGHLAPHGSAQRGGAHDGHLVHRHAARAHPVGQAIWADTLSVLAGGDPGHARQHHGRHGHHRHWANGHHRHGGACSSVPRSTSASRAMAWRRRGSEHGGNDGARAHGRQQQREGAGAAALSPAPPAAAAPSARWNAGRTGDAPQHALQVGDWRTNCRPTRIALRRLSRPSGWAHVLALPAHDDDRRPTDSTAFSTNTQALPALAMMAPATSGPMMREAFIDTPLSASAAGSCGRGTSSGTMAANTGQRMARPMPLAKVSASSSGGVITPAKDGHASTSATTATQNCVKMK
jgi:WS/DGAT/MGAT family acyltransferase